ncbi:MAG: acyl-CoA thioesterase [Actinobacteria bacterium]|nr:acyl-CoA thioesterase [Actinomycetota bacterium]
MTIDGPACFRYDSAVYFDEMDPLGVLHNSRFAVHVERAQSALFEQLGYGWTDLSQRHEDIGYVVRATAMEFTAPVTSPGVMTVEVIAVRLGRTSATWGYRCAVSSGAQEVPVAQGTRVVVKADASGQPNAWTDSFRVLFDWLAAGAQGPRP